MNLTELRKAMESDATKENESLKKELAALKKKYNHDHKELTDKIKALEEDCTALCNRCFVASKGQLCLFCELHGFHCSRSIGWEDKIKAQKQLMKDLGDQ